MPAARTNQAQAQGNGQAAGPDPAAAQAYAEFLIAQANQLERERFALQERIASNRDQLRGMDTSKALTPEQGDWLEDFYPLKEQNQRRSDEEIKRTRLVKEAARKGATGITPPATPATTTATTATAAS